MKVYVQLYLLIIAHSTKLLIMPQLTIYLDEETEEKAREAAQRAGFSLSRWAREKLSAAADVGKTWPEGYFDLFGSIDDPGFEAVDRGSADGDAPRETL